jgi:hypothetical protein
MAENWKVQKGSSTLLNRFLLCLGHLLLVGTDWVESKGKPFAPPFATQLHTNPV